MNNPVNSTMVLSNIATALNILVHCPEFAGLVPEVRVNLVYALPGAKNRFDVAAVDGRITVVRGMPFASGLPCFGSSDHMARLIIEARKFDPDINAGINFKCDNSIIKVVRKYCTEHSLRFGCIDRKKEPEEVTRSDGASMPWKVAELVRSSGGMPRLFYESEGWGKEPLFVCIGLDAIEVTGIAVDIAKRCTG